MRSWGGGFWKKYRPIPYYGWEEFKLSDSVLVSYGINETESERKAREKLGLPLPVYSFTVEKDNAQPRQHKTSKNPQD